MRKLRTFLFGTWHGPVLAWCAALLAFLGLSAAPELPNAALGSIFLGAQYLVAAPMASLFLLGIPAAVFARRLFEPAIAKAHDDYGGRAAKISGEVPFPVAFRPVHPFLAEYGRRVAFLSGRKANLAMDTGGAGRFAVYALESGGPCMADCWKSGCRVNASGETVEEESLGVWARLPGGTPEVAAGTGEIGKAAEANGVPAGTSLAGRRFLGRIGGGEELVRGVGGAPPPPTPPCGLH